MLAHVLGWGEWRIKKNVYLDTPLICSYAMFVPFLALYVIILFIFAEACPAGQYWLASSQSCFDCPQNMYQNETAQIVCKECPDDKYSDEVGAIDANTCKCKYNLWAMSSKKCLQTCPKYPDSDHPGLCSPFIHYVVSNDSVSGQGRKCTLFLCRLPAI